MKGQILISTLIGMATLVGAVVAPTIWFGDRFGDIEGTNRVQAEKIDTIEKNYTRLEGKIDSQDEKLNTILIRLGVNPSEIK